MNTQTDHKQSRREFFRGIMRYLTLGGLLGASGVLLARRKSGECINLEICNGCPIFKRCDLPPALSKKDEQRGNRYAG